MENFPAERLAAEKNSNVPSEAVAVESSCSSKVHTPPYSEKEAQVLAEKLANKDSYREARQVLLTWLEKGECNESNSASFFSLIKLCSKTINRLKIEQKECQKIAENTKKNLIRQNCLIQCDLDKIGNAFEAVQKQDVWNNFTEIQKNNIEMMKKEYLDLKEENLMDIVKDKEPEGVENTDKELKILRQKERNMISKLQSLREEAKDLKTKVNDNQEEILRLKSELEKNRKNVNARSSNTDDFLQHETQIICLISKILFDHECGLSLENIHTHLKSVISAISAREIEILLRRFPSLFEQTVFGWKLPGIIHAVTKGYGLT